MKNIIKKIFILLFCFFWLNSLAQSGKWEIIGNMPFGLSAAEIISGDSLIYFIGGYSDSLQSAVNKIYAYNPERKTWHNLGQILRKRKNFVSLKWNNSVISLGGEAFATMNYSPIEILNLNNFNSVTIDSNKQLERIRATGIINNNYLYIIGGFINVPPHQNNYLIEYDLIQKKITYEYDSLYSFGRNMIDQMSALIDNNIYLFGGLFNVVSSLIYNYDTEHHRMIRVPTLMLEPRADGRAVRLGDSNIVVLIGGYNEKNPALNTVESYQIFNNNNIIKKVLPSLNYKRKDLMAVYFKKKIYVFGGLNEHDDAVLQIESLPVSTYIDDEIEINATHFILKQNYPNPFNPTTTIEYQTKKKGFVSLKFYNSIGQEIQSLVNAEISTGNYKVQFNAGDLPSGMYFYRMFLSESTSGIPFFSSETKKMILIK